MTGKEYFIKNFLKIKQADGNLTTPVFSDVQRNYLKEIERAEKAGVTLFILNKRRRINSEM